MNAHHRVKSDSGVSVTVSKQFLNEVPTMARLDGQRLKGTSNESIAANVYDAIQRAVKDVNGVDAATVAAITNQNLSVHLFDMLVKR